MTSVEISTVLVPNLMNTYDATWGRQFWWRIEATDNTTTIANVITPSKSALTAFTGDGLSTNVDPSI